jgi:predicted nucleotide-binding protein
MTKRKTSMTKLVASVNDLLIIPKEKFKGMVEERINVGNELLSRKIDNKSALNLALKEYEIWNNQSSILLKQSFDDPENEYRTSYDFVNIKGTFFSGSSIEEEAEYLFNDLNNKINFLYQMLEKLPLIKYEEHKQNRQQIIKDEIAATNKVEETRKFHLKTITDESDSDYDVEAPKEIQQETKKVQAVSDFKVEKPKETQQHAKRADMSSGNKVFVVYGHNNEVRSKAARTLEKLGIEPVILYDKVKEGHSAVEIMETYSDVGFALLILTDDDFGNSRKHKDADNASGERENIIFELGYIIGRMGIKSVCVLSKDVELPADIRNLGSIQFDSADHWQIELAKKLKAAGFTIDVNNII